MKKIYVLLILIACCALRVDAQWTQTNGPYGGDIESLAVFGENVFASTETETFLSTNNGESWKSIFQTISHADIIYCEVSDSNIFIGVYGHGVYRSNDGGDNWTEVNVGLSSLSVSCLVASGNKIFAGTANQGSFDNGVFMSSNNGESWERIVVIQSGVSSIAIKDSNIFVVALDDRILLSSNNGKNWKRINNDLEINDISSFAVSDSGIFIATSNGIYNSNDSGKSWKLIDNALVSKYTTSIVIRENYLFAGAFDGVFRSNDNGISWSQVNTGLSNLSIHNIAVNDSYIFVSTQEGVFRSANNGNSWIPIGLPGYTPIYCLAINDSHMFGGSVRGRVFRSADNGQKWIQGKTDETLDCHGYDYPVESLLVIDSSLYAGTHNGVFRSTNNGVNWTEVNNGIPSNAVLSMAVSGHKIFAGTNGGLYLSTNNGENWGVVDKGLPSVLTIYCLVVNGMDMFAGTNDGIFRSFDNGVSWTKPDNAMPSSVQVRSLAISGGTIYAGTQEHGVWRLTNNGGSLRTLGGAIPGPVTSLVISGSNIFAATGSGVYFYSKNSASWSVVDYMLLNIRCLAVNDSVLFAGTSYNDGVYSMPLSLLGLSPRLVFPNNLANILPPNQTLEWNNLVFATSYRVQVSASNEFATNLVDDVVSSV